MKLIKLDDITGSEILAKSIYTGDYQELLTEGMRLKTEYIPKLAEVGITEVFVRDNRADAQPRVMLKLELDRQCKEKVKEVISRHCNNNTPEMMELSKTADSIINSILEEEDVLNKIFDIRERSANIYEHSISTCSLAMLVALKMGLSREEVHDIGVGCLLHDLGLRYITVKYENRSDWGEDETDLEQYKNHPVFGYSAVKNENWLSKTSKEIILCHHEKLNGEGFPLRATTIPITTRISSVCDFFDEAICGIGQERMKVYEAVEYLKNLKGIEFDAEVVEELLGFTAVYPTGSEVVTNEGDLAVVIRQNKGFPERPVLQLLRDKDSNEYEEEKVFDLLLHNSIVIEDVID